jgi:hypothetical protein
VSDCGAVAARPRLISRQLAAQSLQAFAQARISSSSIRSQDSAQASHTSAHAAQMAA